MSNSSLKFDMELVHQLREESHSWNNESGRALVSGLTDRFLDYSFRDDEDRKKIITTVSVIGAVTTVMVFVLLSFVTLIWRESWKDTKYAEIKAKVEREIAQQYREVNAGSLVEKDGILYIKDN